MIKFILIFILLACSRVSVLNVKANDAQMLIENQPGMVKWIHFNIKENEDAGSLYCRDEKIKTEKKKKNGQLIVSAFLAENYFSDLTPFTCKWKYKDKEQIVKEFKISSYDFPKEKLKVDYRKVKINEKDLQRVQGEQMILNHLYKQSSATPYFTKPFIAPLNSFITSIYGTKRVYNNQHKGQHLGTDFRAAVGVPIPVSNRGKVSLAKDLFYTGFTVIVDHGLDIFSVYAHLSEVSVSENQIVEQGAIIGKSGNTGRTSGPHLHWGIKIHGHWVDGFSLIKESKNYVDSFLNNETN